MRQAKIENDRKQREQERYIQFLKDQSNRSLLNKSNAFTMRSAGCIVNDMWDRDVDAKVARTKERPLASGRVSVPEAVALLGVNLTASLAVLWQLNLTTQVLGACCLLPVAIYPAAKRFTNWPQALLGVTFNWGALMVSLKRLISIKEGINN